MNVSNFVFGPISLGLVAASYANLTLPLVGYPRVAMVVMVVLGMAMCTNGIGKVAAANAWSHPVSLLGMLAGGLILVSAVATWPGKPLPLIAASQRALLAVLVLELVKFGLTRVHPLLR